MPQRTTLTLEDDVFARLRAEALRTGKALKTVVNETLRTGLERGSAGRPRRFEIAARDLGVRPEIELDDIEGLLDQIDGPDRR